MGRGKFEREINNKLSKGGTIKAPSRVWTGIEAELNSSLLVEYSARNKRYKWLAVAAVLIAFCSIGSQLFIQFKTDQIISTENYNVLLSGKYDLKTPNTPQTQNSYLPTFIPIIMKVKKESITKDQVFEKRAPVSTPHSRVALIPNIERKHISYTEPKLDASIYNYHQTIQFSGKSRKSSNDGGIWAGIEAGAGNFTTLNTPTILSGIDQLGLARAVGLDGFTNPNTRVNPELNNGLATTASVDVGMKLGNKWTLETGVSYTNVEFTGNASVEIVDTQTLNLFTSIPLEGDQGTASRETKVTIQKNYDYDLEVSNITRFTSIPVQAGYYLLNNNSKMSLRLNLGFAVNYFMASSLTDNLGIVNTSLSDSFNQWSFDGLGGVEIGYSIFDNFNLVLAQNYRQAITPLAEDMPNRGRFVVQTGLQYILK